MVDPKEKAPFHPHRSNFPKFTTLIALHPERKAEKNEFSSLRFDKYKLIQSHAEKQPSPTTIYQNVTRRGT